MTVAVIGATGTLGPHVVRSLHRLHSNVRALTRDTTRARRILGDKVDVHLVDLSDDQSVAEGCRDVSSVLLLTSHAHDMTDVQLRVMRALRRTRVKVVKLSGTSSAIKPNGPYTCRQHWEIEEVLRATGQQYVILRPNAFMQTLIGEILLPGVLAKGVVLNPIGAAGISFIDARDIADATAEVLIKPDWDQRTLTLTGPRAVTYHEIADVLAERLHRAVDVREIDPAQLGADLRDRGTPAWEAEHFTEMYEMFARGESEFIATDLESVTGAPPRTVESYLDEACAHTKALMTSFSE
jgi:NAD(P)H dehydrogenase (quinone)